MLPCLTALATAAWSQETRDPWRWPFSQNSIWNTPLGTGATFVPANLAQRSDERINAEIEYHLRAWATDPLVTVNNPDGTPAWGGSFGQIRVPAYFSPAPWNTTPGPGYSTPNNCTTILSPDGSTMTQLQPCLRDSPGGPLRGYPQRSNADNYLLSGRGIEGTHYGSGLSAMGGSLRVGDLTAAEPPRFALKLLLWGARYLYRATPNGTDAKGPGWRWPATRSDGYSQSGSLAYNGTNPELAMGSLLAIPPAVTEASLQLESDVGRKLFWTLQNYGAYVVDDTAQAPLGLSVEQGVPEEVQSVYGQALFGSFPTSGITRDLRKLLQALQVVTNNTSATVGGPGARRASLAPAQLANPVADPAFDLTTASAWVATGNAALVAAAGPYGSRTARVRSGGEFTQTITGLIPDTWYEVFALGRAAAGGTLRVGARDFGGTEVAATTTATAFVGLRARFRTGPASTSAKIFVTNAAAADAFADDISVTRTRSPSPPVNDAFAAATALAGASTTVQGNAANATREPGEPTHAPIAGGASLWWAWTAPASGPTTLTTSASDYDTQLAVYTGAALASLAAVAANDDEAPGIATSRLTFTAIAGTTYHIALDGAGGQTGNFRLQITQTQGADAFASRPPLPPGGGTIASSNATATRETGEPDHYPDGNPGSGSIWWSWTAPRNGAVQINTLGSNFDTVLAAYTGNTLAALTRIASNDDSSGVTSRIDFSATRGTTYAIAVDGYSSSSRGSIALALIFTPSNQPPILTAVTTDAATDAFADTPVHVSAILATDADDDPLTFTYQWQSTVDGATFTAAPGLTTATLPADPAHSGRRWRCVVTATDGQGGSASLATSAFALDRRPPTVARHGQPWSYDSDLFLAPGPGGEAPAFRFAADSETPAGLSIDPATGLVSGTIDEPAGGFFRLRIERFTAASSVFRPIPLLVGSTLGIHRVPTGRTWSLTQDTALVGRLVVEGAIETAGHTLTVEPTFAAWFDGWYPDLAADPSADRDRDGLADGLEYALGSDPSRPSPADQPTIRIASTNGGRHLEITFRRQRAPSSVSYIVETSPNLATWSPLPTETGETVEPVDASFERVMRTDPTPLGDTPRFIRLRVVTP